MRRDTTWITLTVIALALASAPPALGALRFSGDADADPVTTVNFILRDRNRVNPFRFRDAVYSCTDGTTFRYRFKLTGVMALNRDGRFKGRFTGDFSSVTTVTGQIKRKRAFGTVEGTQVLATNGAPCATSFSWTATRR